MSDSQSGTASPPHDATGITVPTETEIVAVRVFPASRERAYAAFVTPELVAQWWGPVGWRTVVDAMEVRVGGRYRIRLLGPGGQVHHRTGTYREVVPVSLLVRFPNLLFVNPRIPARSVSELVAYLKANPGKVNYGSSGIGTSSHLSVVMFALATGTQMTHIPFRSTGEVVNSMLGGSIDLGIDSMTTTIAFAQSGAVRALAVTTPQRNGSAPDLPTVGETLPGYEATAWQGLFAPAGTGDGGSSPSGLSQVVVTSVGNWRGEGLGLIERVD